MLSVTLSNATPTKVWFVIHCDTFFFLIVDGYLPLDLAVLGV